MWPSTTQRLLIVGGDESRRRAVLAHFPTAYLCDIDAADTVDDMVARLREAAPQPVEHLLWLGSPATDRVPEDGLVDRLHQGILTFFRTVKALLRLGYGASHLGWTVLTAGARAVYQDESVDPHQAALHGLVGAMAQEQHHWQIRLVDIAASTPTALPPLAELLSLPPDPGGAAWACRRLDAGVTPQWYRQQTIPVEPASVPQSTPASALTRTPTLSLTGRGGQGISRSGYRAGGVYVVIGGAGTVGRAWSAHVIRNFGAQIIWIGLVGGSRMPV
jgi:acyl transferase domain-containing protein